MGKGETCTRHDMHDMHASRFSREHMSRKRRCFVNKDLNFRGFIRWGLHHWSHVDAFMNFLVNILESFGYWPVNGGTAIRKSVLCLILLDFLN